MEFKKISSPSLKDLFTDQLQNMILTGELKVGEKLPPERQLSEMMQVSRSVVNSGIAELEQKGFLTVNPRSGTYVADYRRNGNLDTLASIMNFNGGKLRNEEIRSIFEVRIALDSLLVKRCVADISDEDIATLEGLVEKIKDADGADDAAERAFAFQHEFALVSGNVLVPLLFQSFRPVVSVLWKRFYQIHGLNALYQSNYELLKRIKDHDTEGALEWIDYSMNKCISGEWELYYD